MDKILEILKIGVAGVTTFFAWLFGGIDGMIIALLVFIVVDYITGLMCGYNEKKLSSKVGFKGICKKIAILLFVAIANIADKMIFGEPMVLRTVVIFFYLGNEGISIIENATILGLPVPEKLKEALAQLKDGGSKAKK